MADADDPQAAEPDAAARRRYPEYERKTPPISIHELRCEEDDLGRKFFFKPDGTPVCGRLKKRKNRAIEDEACCGIPTREGPCRQHGAGGGRPFSSGGRYSRVLRKWGQLLTRAIADQELLDTQRDIAMLDVLIEKLVRRAEQGDCPSWRAELEELSGELDDAIRRGRQRDVARLMTTLGERIRDGATNDQKAEDLSRAIERRASLANKEKALGIKRETQISVKELVVIFTKWIEVLKQHLEPRMLQTLVPFLERATIGTRAGALEAPAMNGGGGGDDGEDGDENEDEEP